MKRLVIVWLPLVLVLASCHAGENESVTRFADEDPSQAADAGSSSIRGSGTSTNSDTSTSTNSDTSTSRSTSTSTKREGDGNLGAGGAGEGAAVATGVTERAAGSVRFATFNVALNRPNAGELTAELESGDSEQAQSIAAVIQRVRPDVILLNEVDYAEGGINSRLLLEHYLRVPQGDLQAIDYPYHYSATVNTGQPSGLDLNRDGESDGANDAWGYGAFPGQYGMVVYSRFPIPRDRVRTFQNFLWSAMPDAMRPLDPKTGQPWYDDMTWGQLRLSSKSHWDVPISIDGSGVHFLVAHPTPPVFDGPEDRNGCRNHDEIRFWADYVGGRGDYIVDDQGQSGGLPPGALFVIAGDLNADPVDGDSKAEAARQLTEHDAIRQEPIPSSEGARVAAAQSGEANTTHRGDPSQDTGDFNDDNVGNLRIDYCLPSSALDVSGCGVFWPVDGSVESRLNAASDHHLVWVDVVLFAKSGDKTVGQRGE